MRNYIGVDIGGTKCAVSLGREDQEGMRILGKAQFPTKGAPDEVLAGCAQRLDDLLAEQKLRYADIAAIGISCGGPLDSRKGLILSPPNLPGWDRVEIVRFFRERTGIPTALQNDANACAVAEWRFGAGRGTENMIFLTFGTGLGAGLILDGRLYSGTNDMAGEVGHVRLEPDGPVGYGKAGSAEGFCSGGGIGRLAQTAVEAARDRGEKPLLWERAGGTEGITAKLTAELAFAGDAFSRGVYETCGAELGKLLSALIDVLNPQRIILGGVFMRSAALIRPAMEVVIRRESLALSASVCEIVPAGLGESIGDYAALGVASLHASAAAKPASRAVDEFLARHPELEDCRAELETLAGGATAEGRF